MTVRIMEGDCTDSLRTLAAEGVRVQTVVTSPPYYGLRDYRVDGQIGLEATPAAFVARLVAVFRQVREILADDGTLWMNMGDSYNAGSNSKRAAPKTAHDVGGWADADVDGGARVHFPGLKPKDLMGMPWRLAFALQADGWYLRQDIIWSKPNPMPESTGDRCTKAHEYLFLLSKSSRYYFDAKAIAEPASVASTRRPVPAGWDQGEGAHGAIHRDGRRLPGNKTHKAAAEYEVGDEHHRTAGGLLDYSNRLAAEAEEESVEPATRNKRSVWTIAAEGFAEAHFATFPTKLVEPCVLAGSRHGDLVLDPFGGSGTTGLVADRLGRHAVLCELSPTYAAMARRRIAGDAPLFAEVA